MPDRARADRPAHRADGADRPVHRAGTSAYLRELNRRTVYDELIRTPQSRRQLVARTGLSKPTVSGALAHLLDAGLIRADGYTAGRSGPAAELFAPDPAAGFVVGIQLDNRVQVAVADLDGRIRHRAKARNRARTAASLAAAVAALAADTTAAAARRLAGAAAVVVAIAGVPDPRTGAVQRTHLAGADAPGFLDQLDRALGTRCTVDNDVNLAAVAEHRLGAARGVHDFALISLEPGLGLSAFLGGRPHRGVHGAAGEIALLPVVAGHGVDPLVRIAAQRTGEQLMRDEAASAGGMVRLAHRLGLAARTAGDVFRAAGTGDRTARQVVRTHVRHLVLAVAAAAAVLDPALIVVSGPLDDDVAAQVRRALRAAAGGATADIVPGALGDDAVLLGAVAAGLPAARDRVFARAAPTPGATSGR